MAPPPAGQPFDPRSLYSSNGATSSSTASAGASSSSGSTTSKPAGLNLYSSSNGSSSAATASSNHNSGSKQSNAGSAAAAAAAASSSSASSSTAGGTAKDDTSSAGAKKKPAKRRKVNQACIYCRRSHMTCDDGRPCQRCIKRDIGHLCHDEATPGHPPASAASGSGSVPPSAESTPSKPPKSAVSLRTSSSENINAPAGSAAPANAGASGAAAQPSTSTSTSAPAAAAAAAATATSAISGPAANLLQSLGLANSNSPFIAGSSGPYSSASPINMGSTANDANTGGKRSRRSSYSAAASGSYLPSLGGGSSKTERFFLTAADQKDGTRDERLARVIQAKYEAGLLRPYNHVNGYARLNRWMERNVSAASKRRILKPLSVFRPAFRAVAQSLTNIDLVFIEEAFERLLLDYDRVFSTQGIPACLWRRTGEIYKGNKEFAELVGVPIESLREGRLCIYELMAEESAVNYWEKYGAVSFDPGQKAVLTSCVLRTKNKLIGTGATSTSGIIKDPSNPKAAFIHCCFSFTIRRDQWNIPTMIVGNFLPTNPP
ncbi:hypothetical protein BCV70DRAFT_167541 [Testicularia cyperi]|uniref:Zn(2)-C6 fungal-type domain-containing protein n=1 Tax=Testicularia cyperi TaxID=1882483 RepID=A0A317XFH4_9BASI|nr:hypothetical protein BCV70DRAFT_167541 [Testicularia cyperi]